MHHTMHVLDAPGNTQHSSPYELCDCILHSAICKSVTHVLKNSCHQPLTYRLVSCRIYMVNPQLFALLLYQSQSWLKEEGDSSHLCYDTVSLTVTCYDPDLPCLGTLAPYKVRACSRGNEESKRV